MRSGCPLSLFRGVLLVCLFASALGICAGADSQADASGAPEQPYAYVFPAGLDELVERLQREEVTVEELREDIDLDVCTYQIAGVVENDEEGGSFAFRTVARQETRRFFAGTVVVKTDPNKSDVIGPVLAPDMPKDAGGRELLGSPGEGDTFPVVTLASYTPMNLGDVRPLAEKREFGKAITFEALYEGKERVSFDGRPVGGLTWLADGEHYLQVRDGRLYRVHATSGRSVLFVDPNRVAAALGQVPALSEADANSLSQRRRFEMDPQRRGLLIDYENDLYYCTLDGQTAVRLTSSPAQEQYGTFRPDGQFVAFVRENNLYVVDVATQTERALTTDGSDTVFNGQADWVYHEELFSRQRRLFWWSPDGAALAFLRIDDASVHAFTVVNNVPTQQRVEVERYPRPGESNPSVSVGVVSVAGGAVRWADLGDYTEGSFLISGVGWLPDSERVYFYVQDRAQTWLDLCTVSKSRGEVERLLRDKTEAWIESPGELTFLQDGSFLLASERTGWNHLYLYDKAGELKHAVTEGRWEVRRLHHFDEENGWVYFTGTRDSHLAENLYRVQLDGSRMQRLTRLAGAHRADVSPNGKYFIDTWSDANTPTRVALRAADGTHVRMLDTNPVYEREEYRFGAYEQFQIETADGFMLEASLLKPPDFERDRKYPVWFTTYGGPHSPTIRDNWSGGRAWDQMLAQMGVLVFHCDPRSASGKGACSAWTAYRQLGVQELKDIEEAIAWLKEQPYVDGARIGMSGHSYGGFMTAYALTHSDVFAGGIAGAPVTDWRLYDTIYTERYMDTPQDNPDGYAQSSVVEAAKDLQGKLLIIHGAIDDNVHFQNSLQLARALQEADREFQIMVYPESRHGIGGTHYQRLMLDFIKSVLQLPESDGSDQAQPAASPDAECPHVPPNENAPIPRI
ncbi:MAG: S9 family peptidase [Sedimentisphaerales bacterium]|nr:S9 family peptidase [Sedimentisphaerales bacterium]